jgi:hypothetical protein
MSQGMAALHRGPTTSCSWCNMGSIERINRKPTQRLGNDLVYGQGTDGDVVISSNTTLTSDKYYNNLTVNNGITLLTNGYRIFIKGTLTNNGFIGIGTVSAGEPSGAIADGTISGTSTLTAITYSLGGSGGGATANAAPSWLVQNLQELANNKLATSLFSPSAGQTAGGLYGGSAGLVGASGNSVGYTNADSWAGKAGGAGAAGNAGAAGRTNTHYQYNNHTVVDGHHFHNAGNAGATGNPGNAGTAGTAGAGGAGGTGGRGGGIVLIFAKSIAGTGTIFAKGMSGSAGSAGNLGTAGAAGNPGNTGANGNTGHHYAHANTFHHAHCGHTAGNCKGGCDHSQHGQTHLDGGAGGTGGAGGAAGAGSPAVAGNAGASGNKGGGGAIVIVTDSTPSNQSYLVTSGASGSGSPTGGFTYIILNQ